MVKDIDVEIPPGNFIGPGGQAFLVASHTLLLAGGNQALFAGKHPVGQVRGEQAGTIYGRQVAQVLIVPAVVVEELFQLPVGGVLAGFNKPGWWIIEAFWQAFIIKRLNRLADGLGNGKEGWLRLINPASPPTGKRGEHGIGLTLLSKDGANRRYRLVPVFIHRYANIIKGVFYGLVAAPFVNSVFLIEMHMPDTLAPAEFFQFFNAIGERGCGHE